MLRNELESARATARKHTILNFASAQFFQRTRGELLLVGRAFTRRIIQHACELRGNEDAQILVGGLGRDVAWCKNLHD